MTLEKIREDKADGRKSCHCFIPRQDVRVVQTVVNIVAPKTIEHSGPQPSGFGPVPVFGSFGTGPHKINK